VHCKWPYASLFSNKFDLINVTFRVLGRTTGLADVDPAPHDKQCQKTVVVVTTNYRMTRTVISSPAGAQQQTSNSGVLMIGETAAATGKAHSPTVDKRVERVVRGMDRWLVVKGTESK